MAMKYLTLKEASADSGLSVRRLQQLCASAEIKGAIKDNGAWMIPEDFDPPKSGRAPKQSIPRLPIGLSFEESVRNATVIDKSLLIRDLLFSQTKTTLFTRPRRFGKSMNLDMLRCFFESNHPERADLFKGKAIADYTNLISLHQGKHPVISLSFLGMDSPFDQAIGKIGMAVYENYRSHKDDLNLDDIDVRFFSRLGEGEATQSDIESSLSRLISRFRERPIILIDEYDSPLQYAFLHDEYARMTSFMRNFLSLSLKDNPHYFISVLTGVSRMAKESIFSGFNSVRINGVGSLDFASYFGFTEKETKALLSLFHYSSHLQVAKDYYDGYRFGQEKVFNPWSIANFINSKCVPEYYWANTSSNDLILACLERIDEATMEKLTLLGKGETLYGQYVGEEVSYDGISSDPNAIWPLLLSSGYLTLTDDGGLAIPNKEARHCFQRGINAYLLKSSEENSSNRFLLALERKDMEKAKQILSSFIEKSVSNLLSYKEEFYHELLLGMLFFSEDEYEVRTEYEQGEGRSDIILLPKKDKPAIVIEVKRLRSSSMARLEEESHVALTQIQSRGYLQKGIPGLLYGIAFCKKKVAIASCIQ